MTHQRQFDFMLLLLCIAAAVFLTLDAMQSKPCVMTLTWDPPATDKFFYEDFIVEVAPTQIDGYLVKYGKRSGDYSTAVNVWGKETRHCTLKDLEWNTVYYATVQSMGGGQLSEPAPELVWRTPRFLNKTKTAMVRLK